MRIEIPHVLVEEHHDRLRDAAQAPSDPLVARVWAMLRRREPPAPIAWAPARELERLAA